MFRNTANIKFETNETTGALSVYIETERLHLESASSKNFDDYCKLLGNTEVMAKFADGNSWNTEKTRARFGTWTKRWNDNDPFSSLAVFKKEDDKFIGHVVLGYGDDPGQSELAYVFDKPIWGKGFGKEAVSTVVKEYAPELVNHNYKLEGVPFTSITATTRPDNEASFKILNGIGMKSIKEELKFGHNRHTFFISTSELCSRIERQAVNNVNSFENRANKY